LLDMINPSTNKGYNILLDAELLEVEKRAQQVAGWLLALTLVFMNLFIRLEPDPSLYTLLNFTHTFSVALVIWFIGTSVLINKGYYHPLFKYVNLVMQVSTVTFYMLTTARLVNVEFALSSTAPLFYLLVIGLTSLSLSPLLAILAGGFSAGQFFGVYWFWLLPDLDFQTVLAPDAFNTQIVLKMIVFIMMGIGAMLIARSSRNMLEKVVTQVCYEEQIKLIEDEMSQAAELQNRLIPSSFVNPRYYNVETFYSPAEQVGGDYFDIIELNNDRCLVVIADVSGKGYSAAILMSNIQAMVKTLADQNYHIDQIVRIINHSVYHNSVRGRFVTIAFMELNPHDKEIKYINCGHNPPILLDRDKEIMLLDQAGPVLGVIENYPCEIQKIDFNDGDIILAYTDGLSELRNRKGKQLGQKNIISVLQNDHPLNTVFIKQFLLAKIYEHSQDTEILDDLSFVCVQACFDDV